MQFELPDRGIPDLSANDSVSKSPFAAIANSLFGSGDGKKKQGQMPGLGFMGDFDLDSFLSSTLQAQRQGGINGGTLTQAIGSLFGLGKKGA